MYIFVLPLSLYKKYIHIFIERCVCVCVLMLGSYAYIYICIFIYLYTYRHIYTCLYREIERAGMYIHINITNI